MSSEVSFDALTQGQVAGDVQGAEVSGPGGANASPFMMKRQVCGQTLIEVFGFTNVHGIPVAIDRLSTCDVDAGFFEVDDPNKVELERIGGAALASPINDTWGCRIRYRSYR